ncbi:MAG TPA: GDSL-type esterase/lipase family protein [Segetibacter sp.]
MIRILITVLTLISITATGQIRISDMPTYIGDPGEGWVPIVINNANRKVAASYFGAAKVDSLRVSNDTLYYRSSGSWKGLKIQGSGGGAFTSDINTLPEIQTYTPAIGITSSNSVTNYSHTAVDDMLYKFSTTRAGNAGSEYGGWLAASLSGDSLRATAPFWVVIGDSQAEGNPGTSGRLNVGGAYQYNYADVPGQLSYHLRYLTNMRWYNHGIGGQTTTEVRNRFYRDVLGETSNPSDGRGTKTLSRKPQGVVIIAGINDLALGATPATVKANLEWMAATCQQYGIQCVVLNLPGHTSQPQSVYRGIDEVNLWLKSGALNQFGASIVDYNTWWKDPTYGDNSHKNTAYIVDQVHPSSVGYDSLANFIYRSAKLPKLTKAVIHTEISPDGFTGYSRPTSININNTTYALSGAVATINLTGYVSDSSWIKINASTNVTGTSYTGISHIQWFTDNNPANQEFVTQKTLYEGGTKSDVDLSSIVQRAVDFNAGRRAFEQQYANGTTAFYSEMGPSAYWVYGGGSANRIGSNLVSVVGDMSVSGIFNTTSRAQFYGGFTAVGLNGFGVGTATATVHIVNSSGDANTAPLKFSNGIQLAAPEVGVLEPNTGTTELLFTTLAGARYNLQRVGSVPATATSTGAAGTIAYDSSFLYVCISTNTWIRTPLATW